MISRKSKKQTREHFPTKDSIDRSDSKRPSAVFVVAHPDDSLLFQSPSLLSQIQRGGDTLTVHLNAGDHGLGADYWRNRERGIEVAYARMANRSATWESTSLRIGNQSVVLKTLVDQPSVKLVFMRLPDGGFPLGLGSRRYGFQSLSKLLDGTIKTIDTVDHDSTFDRAELISGVSSLFESTSPDLIAALDYSDRHDGQEHPDHYASAAIAYEAHLKASFPHIFVGFSGYSCSHFEANVDPNLLDIKTAIFNSYSEYDSQVPFVKRDDDESWYSKWLCREYTLGVEANRLMAIARYEQVVRPGALVRLDGHLSAGPSHQALTFHWRQTLGIAVTLDDPHSANPSFVAPLDESRTEFELVVSDEATSSTPSFVGVSINKDLRDNMTMGWDESGRGTD